MHNMCMHMHMSHVHVDIPPLFYKHLRNTTGGLGEVSCNYTPREENSMFKDLQAF